MNCIDDARVEFDISSVEKVFRTPKTVLQDVDAFWREETAYEMAVGWSPPGYPVHIGGFREKVEELAKQPLEEREQNPYFRFAKTLTDSITRIRSDGLSHICSYLPRESKMVSTIYLACFIFLGKDEPQFVPSAFIYGGSSCLNVTSDQWGFNENRALNEIIHELYHNGYETHQIQCPLKDEMSTRQLLAHILWQLHNEGMATYVAYKAQHLFPKDNDEDYAMLENPSEVSRLLGNVKKLIRDASTELPTDVKEGVIQVGISERAFYVAGAHMASIIEDKAGKNALIESVTKGQALLRNLQCTC